MPDLDVTVTITVAVTDTVSVSGSAFVSANEAETRWLCRRASGEEEGWREGVPCGLKGLIWMGDNGVVLVVWMGVGGRWKWKWKWKLKLGGGLERHASN